jgi:hypothetical protein
MRDHMRRTIAALGLGILLAGSTATAQTQNLFKADEINLIMFGDYFDKHSDQWGGGVGLQYFTSRVIGLGVSTHWENFGGSFFDNVNGELYLRIPLGRLPIAPYAVGTGGYDFEREGWFGGGGGGAEWRFSKEVGVFGDIQWFVREGGDRDGIGVRFGLRLAL